MSDLATTHPKHRLVIRLAGLATSGAVLATSLAAFAIVTPHRPLTPGAAHTTTIIGPIIDAGHGHAASTGDAVPAGRADAAGGAKLKPGSRLQPTTQSGKPAGGSTSSTSSSSGPGAGNAAKQEELWMSQQPTPGEILAQPACDDSYNGCAP